MSQKQKIVLWTGIIVIVAMGIFPPWLYTQARYVEVQTNAGHHFLLNPPLPQDRVGYGIRLDTSRLFVQWVIVAVVTVGLIISFQDKKPKDG